MRFKILLTLAFIAFFSTLTAFAQTETLINQTIIDLTKAGISKDIIVQKIRTTGSDFDISATALIELKKAEVADEVMSAIMSKAKVQPEKTLPATKNDAEPSNKKLLTPLQILRSSQTVALHKDSLNPSRQALEKELMKRPDWQKLNLSITEDKNSADLSIQIGFVPLSLITHRYVYRIYDRRSGLVIAAGETTSWGSLAKNLARHISKQLTTISQN